MRRLLPLFAAGVFLSIFTPTAHPQEIQKRHVLVLNSYHHGLSWTDNIIKGTEAALKEEVRDVELHLEFMDAKRFFSDRCFERLYETYREKYGRAHFEVVIAADNDALDFVRRYHEEL